MKMIAQPDKRNQSGASASAFGSSQTMSMENMVATIVPTACASRLSGGFSFMPEISFYKEVSNFWGCVNA
jgi:hypothetical protein